MEVFHCYSLDAFSYAYISLFSSKYRRIVESFWYNSKIEVYI